MEKSTFEAIASNLDNRLCSGGLHFIIGITGTGKSSICNIIQKNNKSDAVFLDAPTEHSNECYQQLADDIKNINKHVVIDGLIVCSYAGSNVFYSLLKHVNTKKMGVLVLAQSFDSLSREQINSASSISLISNLYPRENGNIYLHSVDIKNDANEKYESLKEFWMKYWR